MVEPKIILTMLVPGNSMYTEDQCKELNAYDTKKIYLSYKEKGKPTYENLIITTRQCRPAKHTLKINKETYEAWLQSPEGTKISKKQWDNLPKKVRIETQLDMIAKNFSAIKYSYQILED